MFLYNKLLEEYSKQVSPSLKRFAARLQAIADIGLTPNRGSSRIGYSSEERQAKTLVKQWMQEAGLSVREDAVGNVFGLLQGSRPELPVVLSGSHIDSVPDGGHFDGVVGVLTALEVAQLWSEQRYQPVRSLEVAIFADEEGSRFHASLTGSHFMIGELSIDDVKHYRDDEGLSFSEVLAKDGLQASEWESAVRKADAIHAFVEVHIEQGMVLEQKQLPIGIVNAVAGPAWVDMKWFGRASHAGTTPMGMRQDALAAASECLLAIERLPAEFSPTAVATVGKLDVYPNGSNVIPGEVSLVIDVRDIKLDSRNKLIEEIRRHAEEIAARRGVEMRMEANIKVDPTAMSQRLIAIATRTFETMGVTPFYLPSGAGHDAMVIGRHVPTCMVFIRCLEGISHNPAEWASLADMELGIEALNDILIQLTKEA